MTRTIWRAIAGALLLAFTMTAAKAQEGLGPFMPHNGGEIYTAWTNAYGPDADSYIAFANVGPNSFDINYTSSRGMRAVRRIQTIDRMNARTLVLGFNVRMPLIIPNTTTLGTSDVILQELRTTGQASSSLVFDAAMSTMTGGFTLVSDKEKFAISMDGDVVQVPVVHATGSFQGKGRRAQGDFWFLNNKNNPLLLQYTVNFTGEKTPRTERFVRVTPGPSERSAMEQALKTMRTYATYGIHFDFDKSSIQNESYGLIKEMVTTLNNNPLWTVQIVGHTDSTGADAYNQKLSLARANSLKAALVKRGISPDRLTTLGAGASQPVATNKTIQGRALNRRVVLTRTDR
jgi:outer membrane protein OmpA-like peptidoglycan-associated protein